ncbi:initiation factor 2 [Rhizopogon vinicolor AM-OR11-026]|uniref:Translation initiation factor IF-2, mitochondrial n=1 Tax=Rhizopogon vinicolor AM-OR11-026 TaxID=1314800 RepID=A0A1B7N233_9AGAM|nr:initiation factor 2 [Rhizopogon vinicolor AM-OR11-026]
MHRRKAALCAFQLTQRRSASTAANAKPSEWAPLHPLPPLQPTPSKWARAQTASFIRDSDDFRGVSLRGGPASSTSKWARPASPQPRPGGSNLLTRASDTSGSGSSSRRILQRDQAPHMGARPSPPQKESAEAPKRQREEPYGERKNWKAVESSQVRVADAAQESSRFSAAFTVDDHSDVGRNRRSERVNLKDRGSLRHARDGAIPSHPRMHQTNQKPGSKAKKAKAYSKKVAVDVYIPTTVSVGQLARLLNVRQTLLQRKMVEAGMAAEASYDHVLTSDYAALLAEEFGRNPIIDDEAAFDIYPPAPHPDPTTLPTRPPIITIMGHVDHGKTTLLDTLRSASVAAGEAGGITQHIGAFSVPVKGSSSGSITFLDTPGHAAFSAMRSRGASVTDIIVLVVAADDGVMPQTKEVIELIKAEHGKVGVIVAINKVDKPEADVEKVQHALLAEGIQLEAFGGDIPSIEVSGLTGQGLDDLIETLSLMAEVQDLRAEQDGPAYGHVIESKMHKGLGSTATVLVSRGRLISGAHILAGTSCGKVRLMSDSSGAPVKAAYPGMAVTVSGWRSLPGAGDEVVQGSEGDVKKALANRVRKKEVETVLVDAEAINVARAAERERVRSEEDKSHGVKNESDGGPKELRLVIKGDVSGSVEAVVGALEGIGNNKARVKVVSTGVGDVMESDVMMAKAVEGMIIAFSVNTPRLAEGAAAQNHVPIYSSKIIYRIMDEVRDRVTALLPCTYETKVTGEATVLQLFDIHVKGKTTKKIAGCRVSNGTIEKSKGARVVRNGQVIYEGTFEALKQQKKDVPEVKKGTECGISLQDFEDLRDGDLIQMYQTIEIPGVL